MEVLRKLLSAYRRYGFSVLRVALGKAFPSMAPCEQIDVYEQTLPPTDAQAVEWTVSRVEHPRDPLLATLQSKFGCPALTRKADPRTECYVALSGAEVVGYAWVIFEEFVIKELDYLYTMSAGEFFIFDCFVPEDWRGKGIYPAMLSAILSDQSQRNPSLRRALIGVSSLNRSSARGIIKAGFVLHSSITRETC